MRAIEPLFPDQPNCARYLPAISQNYAEAASNLSWSFAGLPGTMLNYLQLGGFFRYPATLVSAGQAAKTAAKAARPTMVTSRHKAGTFTIADSGGFQIQQGTLKWEGEPTVLRMLRWMEDHGDWVMALDFPTGGISMGNVTPHVRRLHAEGLGPQLDALNVANEQGLDFNACLLQTRINTEFMLQERDTSKAGFLVVLQGRNEAESSTWYREFQPLIADGIAFAGAHARNYRLLLNRLLDMRADGTLRRLKHVHILGTSTIECAVLFTAIQRAIRQHDNPDFQITYDTSNPMVSAMEFNIAITSYGLDYVSAGMGNKLVSMAPDWAYDRTLNEWCADVADQTNDGCRETGRDCQFPAFSEVGKQVKIGDLLDLSSGTAKPITNAMLLVACHNTQVYVDAHRNAVSNWYHANDGRSRFPVRTRVLEEVIKLALDPHKCPSPYVLVSESRHALEALV